jgi:hypothetical protein
LCGLAVGLSTDLVRLTGQACSAAIEDARRRMRERERERAVGLGTTVAVQFSSVCMEGKKIERENYQGSLASV